MPKFTATYTTYQEIEFESENAEDIYQKFIDIMRQKGLQWDGCPYIVDEDDEVVFEI